MKSISDAELTRRASTRDQEDDQATCGTACTRGADGFVLSSCRDGTARDRRRKCGRCEGEEDRLASQEAMCGIPALHPGRLRRRRDQRGREGDICGISEFTYYTEQREQDTEARTKPKPGATRYGEARHPGPAQSRHAIGVVEYKAPHKEGFHGALVKRLEGELPEPAESSMKAGLVVETCNATSWGPLRRYLRRTKADVVLAQEHHVGPEQLPAKTTWALRNGWHAIFAPAQQGEGSGWRAGVAVLARPHIGLSLPRVGSHVVIPHRAVAASIQPPGHRRMTVLSLYLEDGKGTGTENLAHLAQVGNFIKSQGDDVPYIVGGDFQCSPADIAATGLATQMGGDIVASGCPRGTCRSSRHASEIDFYIIHRLLTVGVDTVTVVEGAGTRPHVPVALSFKPRLTTARALVLRMPPPIGTTRVHGPLPPPPEEWNSVADEVAELVKKTRDDGFIADEGFEQQLERAYEGWADLAELEVEAAADDARELPVRGTRGRRPQLRWRSVLPERPPRPFDDDDLLTKWRDIANVLAEMKRIAWQAGGHHDSAGEGSDDDEPVADDLQGGARQARRVDLDKLAECIDDIRVQLNGIGAVGHGTNGDCDTHQAEGEDDGITYGMAVVRMRAIAATINIEVRNARRAGNVPIGDAARGISDAAGAAQRLGEELDVKLNAIAAGTKRRAEHEWKAWILRNLHSGAKNAHKFLRLPEEWRPTTVIDPDGVTTADPLQLIEGYREKYDALWNQGEGRAATDNDRKPWERGGNEPLQRPTPAEIRAASRTFSTETSVAYDGFAMRHYEWLSDIALEVLADIIEMVERTGRLPRQPSTLAMPMLSKPRGGHRAIATYVSLYRLWTRLRRDVVRQWEETVDRHYFAAGSARSPQDSVWRQAARAEAAVAEHRATATLLWDLAAFFETVKRVPLWFRAKRLGFPTTVAAVSLNAYNAVRLLSLAGALSRPVEAANGIPAGCGFAMSLTKAYCVEAFDRVVNIFAEMSPSPPALCAYVDDLAISAEGSHRQVTENLQRAMEALRGEVEGPLACRIEADKAAVVASSSRLVKSLRESFGAYAGPGGTEGATNTAVTNLGIDFAPGRRRRSHGPMAKRRRRMEKLKKQLGRVNRLRAIAGRRTPAIFVSGPLAAATYGAAVNGLSDAEALRLRRAAAHAFTPRARGRSLRRLLLIVGVPTWKAEVAVILQYAREVWAAGLLGHRCPVNGQMTLTQVSKIWAAVKTDDVIVGGGSKRVWAAARGPITAMHLSLHRVGWRMEAPFEMVSDLGDTITLTKVAPKLLEQLLHDAVIRTLQREVGASIAAEDPTFEGRRAAAEHITAQLKSDRAMSPLDRAAYMSVACGALMTMDRAQKAGYLVRNVCTKCGRGPDTPHHRIWKCQAEDVVKARNAVAPPWIRREAANADTADNGIFWTTGFLPHPGDEWPRPDEGNDAHWEWAGEGDPSEQDRTAAGKPHLHGSMYIDGSCTAHVFAELRRAGSAIVQWSAATGDAWIVKYPVPRMYPQTPQAAEYIALALTRQSTDTTRASNVASDCANVVADTTVRRMTAIRAGRTYAAINRENLADTAWVRSAVVRKVPAHVNPYSVPEGPQREDAIGNGKADTAAKQAVDIHDQPPPAVAKLLEAQLRKARIVVRTIATVTQLFPPMPKERLQRPPRPVAGSTGEQRGRAQLELHLGHVAVHQMPETDAQPDFGGTAIGGALQGHETKLMRARHRGKRSPTGDDYWERAHPILPQVRRLRRTQGVRTCFGV